MQVMELMGHSVNSIALFLPGYLLLLAIMLYTLKSKVYNKSSDADNMLQKKKRKRKIRS